MALLPAVTLLLPALLLAVLTLRENTLLIPPPHCYRIGSCVPLQRHFFR